MKVAISVFGKFHLFHLARQLQTRGLLSHVVSTYPRRKLGGEGLPAESVLTFPYVHLPWLAMNRIGQQNSPLGKELYWQVCQSLDSHALRHLGDADVLVGISGSGLGTGREIQRRGGRYICDRGSSHIRYRDHILQEESDRWNIPFHPTDPRLIAREEAEYAEADIITVPSEYARRSFIASGVPAEKLAKVPYGADRGSFHPVATPDPDTFDVLYTGMVSLGKGVPYLLQAFAGLKHPKKRLTLVGAVPEEFEILVRNGRLPMKDVELKGIVPHSGLKEIMSRSHVLVLPSIDEGFGMVLGEALACGCPVISTCNTAGEDLFSDGVEGFIVPIRDPGAIRERLESLAQDPALRAAMSAAALRRVGRLGGWDRYGADFVDVLEKRSGFGAKNGGNRLPDTAQTAGLRSAPCGSVRN